jgi:hypothetical protein
MIFKYQKHIADGQATLPVVSAVAFAIIMVGVWGVNHFAAKTDKS